MNDNKEKNSSSLFLYTALIFVVALIMIIISFFGQKNLSDKQPAVESPAPQNGGITQSAAILSEENSKLMQEKVELQQQVTQFQSVIDAKTSENSRLLAENAVSELLFAANAYYQAGNIEKAREMLASVNTSALTSDQAVFYSTINELINGGIN